VNQRLEIATVAQIDPLLSRFPGDARLAAVLARLNAGAG